MASIPASKLVSVIPSVLGAGGSPLSLNAVFLTGDESIPIGTVKSFSSLTDVGDWFGESSAEYELASIYFSGFTNCTVLPGTLYFYQYNATAVGAYLRSGSFEDVALSTLQGYSGTLIVSIDGETVTSASIDLSSATSWSNAAALMQAGLQTSGGIFTGQATQAASVVTITTVTTGAIHVGDTIVGTGINATVVSFGTGTGGLGTYNVSNSATVGTATDVTVTSDATVAYDSQRHAFIIGSPTTGADSTIGYATGTLATNAKLTQAAGGTISEGAAAATPAASMDTLTGITQNWASFMTVTEQILSVKLQFAAWVNSTDPSQRFMYVCQDSDVQATTEDSTTAFGVQTAAYNGVVPVYDPDSTGLLAAFVCGVTASINFEQTNGRITYAFRGNSLLTTDVTDASVAQILIDNGYNFYGAYATANDSFQLFQPGQISGDWNWIDTYVNQVEMNASFQLALMELLTNSPSIPYNNRGYTMIRAAMSDPITAALNFGSIQPGVSLSNAQKAAVNTAAGVSIADTIQQVGYYLLIQDASATARGNRTSPPMTLWYTDGGSIQKLTLASIDIE